jgi:hypothetical protein
MLVVLVCFSVWRRMESPPPALGGRATENLQEHLRDIVAARFGCDILYFKGMGSFKEHCCG